MDTLLTVTEEDVLKNLRSQVRANLMILRGKLTMMGWLPECAICRLPARYPEICESLIPAYSVRGEPLDVRRALIAPENCVLVHSGRCYDRLHSEEGRRQALKQLAREVGTGALVAWLEKVAGLVSEGLAMRARQELLGADHGSPYPQRPPARPAFLETKAAASEGSILITGAIQTELLGQRLAAYQGEDGQVYLPFEGVCQALGMRARVQKRRINGDPILAEALVEVLLAAPNGDGDGYDRVQCLDLRVIPYWLNQIKCDQVKEEVQEELIRFKRRSVGIAWERSKGQIFLEAPAG